MIEQNDNHNPALNTPKIDNKFTSKYSSKRAKYFNLDNQLNRNEQLQLIQWCVELRSNQEIADLVKATFGKDLTRQAVWRYRQSKKWKPIIERLRARFENSMIKIPIANKVDRLRLLQKVITEGLKWSLKTITKDGDEIYELKLGAVTKAIKEARVEIEGEKALIDQSTHYHVTAEGLNEARKRANEGIVVKR